MDLRTLPALQPGLEPLFDAVADDYDQSGVAFFQPIAARLVDLVAPQPGERALDIGCGRGAVTERLARAVLPSGHVTAVDLSGAMVERTRALVPEADVRKLDAVAPDLPAGGFDVATASLVLFFLPEPVEVARRWLRLLTPGGRLGLTTFGPVNDLWRSLDELFKPWLPPHLRDPRIVGKDSPFGDDARFEALLRSAGASEVETHVEPLSFTVDGPEQWLRFSLGTGQRAMWGAIPAEERPRIYQEGAALIEAGRGEDGTAQLGQTVRYSVAR